MTTPSDFSEQQEICKRFDSDFWVSQDHLKLGIAKNVLNGIMPMNGMRHTPEGSTTGWYIWAGEEFSEDQDFFVPLHVEHIKEWCPLVVKYLGLAPGFRFLITDTGYEDVWRDEKLIL